MIDVNSDPSLFRLQSLRSERSEEVTGTNDSVVYVPSVLQPRFLFPRKLLTCQQSSAHPSCTLNI